GKEQVKTEHMKLPPDLANGMIFTLLKNIAPESGEAKASMVVTTPKPRLVKQGISAQGYALRRKNRDRGCHWISGPVVGEAAPRYPCLGFARGGPSVREIKRPSLSGRSDLAN